MPTWMHRPKDQEAARQRAHRERRQAKGNCIKCGLRCAPNSVQLCETHLAVQRIYANARNARKRKERHDPQD